MPSEIRYGEIEVPACDNLILRHHYLGKRHVQTQLGFGAYETTPYLLLACVTFSNLTGRLVSPRAWELTRLVRLPEAQLSLSKLIGKSVGFIRGRKLIDLLISFADATEGHHGGIYQSCSWLYSGMREQRLDGFHINEEFVAARTCNHRWGTSGEDSLKRLLKGKLVVPHYDEGKHCYWKPLNKLGLEAALAIGLRSLNYPKPALDSDSEGEVGHRKGKKSIQLGASRKTEELQESLGGDDLADSRGEFL